MYLGRPVTLSGMSRRCTLRPATDHWPGGFPVTTGPSPSPSPAPPAAPSAPSAAPSAPRLRTRPAQRPVGQAGAAGRGGDLAVLDARARPRRAQPGGGGGHERQPGPRAGLPERAARILDRPAARGHALVRAGGGRYLRDPHPVWPHVELLGGDLGQRRPHALPVLHLAGGHGDHADGAEVEPSARKDRHAVGLAARCPAAVCPAARWTARSTRPCAPHRHRWGCRASRTCSSVGAGLDRSSATALITSPAVQ